MADDKTKPTKLSVAAFIDTLADPARRGDAKALVKLKSRRCGGAFSSAALITAVLSCVGSAAALLIMRRMMPRN